jgi:Flp pilus assembly protein TadG
MSTAPSCSRPVPGRRPRQARSQLRRARDAGSRCRGDDRTDGGYVLIEFLFWAPFLLLIVLPFAVLAGRLVLAGSLANGAAADAARAASLQRSDAAARTAAAAAAEQSLEHGGISCRAFSVTLTGSTQPGGVVTVTVSCTAPLSDLAMPGVPGSKTLTATASAPIEITRGIT